MNREEAIKYLEKHDVEATEKNIKQIMKEGKIYGDPSAEIDF